MNKFYAYLLALFFQLFSSYASHAIDYQEYLIIHNANQCNNYFDHFELKYQIPKHLLRSISIIETGRWNHNSQMFFPWPWSINHAGKSYYFSNKKEAILKVKELLESGFTNIDIGCMQINLHHHPDAFLDLNQAFEPKDNIEYAAIFLIQHYQQSQNWQQAIAFYHSQTQAGKLYANKVLKTWSKYQDNKYSSNCINYNGKLTPCNNTTEANIYSHKEKEKLPFSKANDTNYSESYVNKPKKDPKRLKSSMILYSTQDQSQ